MVGVKSTALRFGSSTKKWVTGFAIACIGNLALSGYNAELGTCLLCAIPYDFFIYSSECVLMFPRAAWQYYTFLIAAAGHLGWQIFTVDLSSRADCNRK